MCYPALIGLALSAAGTGANYAAQSKVIGAREDVARAEGDRQKGFQDRADAVINQNLTRQSPAAQNQALAQTAEQRTSALAPSQSLSEGLPTSGSAPIEVKGEIARQMADSIRASRTHLGAQARLGAFNQNQTENQRLLGRGMSDIGQIADASQGSAGVLPYALDGAANAGRSYQTAADLFNLGGQAVSLYGMTRQPTAAKPKTVNAAPAPRRAPAPYVGPRMGP